MKRGGILCCALLGAILTSCCASRNMIVLLPDNDGHVGEVQIENRAGTHTINQAWHVSHIENADTAPGTSDLIEHEKVDRLFGPALEALPEPPPRFIVHFKTDSTEVVDNTKDIVSEVVREISERDSKDVGVMGYTDTTAPDDYNMKLSYERAVRVKEILVSEGISPDIIEVSYYGEYNPLIDRGDNVPERRNRRVEIYVR